tara:strand:- start:568 stop:858 length:291 start_codon:yes stop_codon:yes gene_type:complete
MKIAILGKRDLLGTVPTIRMKGLSRAQYAFDWNGEAKRYVYEAKNQKEVEDIFRTQGKIYRAMFFIPMMEEEKKPKKKKRGRPKKIKRLIQAVDSV